MILAIVLAFAAAAPPQDPPLAASWEELRSGVEGNEVVYLLRGVAVDGAAQSADPSGGLRLRARELELRLDRLGYRALTGDPEALALLAEHPLAPARAPAGLLARLWNERFLAALGLPPQAAAALRSVELRGGVEIDTAGMELRCELLEHRPREGWSRLEQADLLLPLGFGPNGWPLRVIAAHMQEDGAGALHAQDASLSTCDAPAPHFELRVSSLRGEPAPRGYRWGSENGWLALGGSSLLPLPTPDIEPGAGDSLLSLHGVRLGSNKRDGQAIELDLRGGRRFGEETESEWRLLPGYRTSRGLPLAAELALKSGGYQGSWELFALQDAGTDAHRYARTIAREEDFRHRERLWNRFELGADWRLDADLVLSSDPLVDPEFFEERWRSQDDALSELYLRRDGDRSFFDARAEARLDEVGPTPLEGFGPPGGPAPVVLESLPVLRWQAYPTTLATVPVGPFGGADHASPLTLSYGAELGRFRLRDRELLTVPGVPSYTRSPAVTRDRLRAWTELVLPLRMSGLFLRPGARLHGLAYDEDATGAGAADRALAEGFVEVGTMLVKDWDHGWQHRVVPEVRFRDLAASGDRPARLTQLDAWDAIRPGKVVELSLRQQWIDPGGEPWADVELLAPYYPDPADPLLDPVFPVRRPGEAATSWGPAELRTTWTPGAWGDALRGVRLEARLRQDLHRADLVEQFARLTLQPNERVDYGVAFRKVDGVASQVEAFAEWRISDDWGVAVRQPYNFRPGASKRSELALRRYGHDFVFEFGVERDPASGQSGFYFNLMPRFLVDQAPRGAAGE